MGGESSEVINKLLINGTQVTGKKHYSMPYMIIVFAELGENWNTMHQIEAIDTRNTWPQKSSILFILYQFVKMIFKLRLDDFIKRNILILIVLEVK